MFGAAIALHSSRGMLVCMQQKCASMHACCELRCTVQQCTGDLCLVVIVEDCILPAKPCPVPGLPCCFVARLELLLAPHHDSTSAPLPCHLQRPYTRGWRRALRQRGWAQALLQAAPRSTHTAAGPARQAAAWCSTPGWPCKHAQGERCCQHAAEDAGVFLAEEACSRTWIRFVVCRLLRARVQIQKCCLCMHPQVRPGVPRNSCTARAHQRHLTIHQDSLLFHIVVGPILHPAGVTC